MFVLLLAMHGALMYVYLHIETVHVRFLVVKNVDSVNHFAISLVKILHSIVKKVHCRRHIKKVLS